MGQARRYPLWIAHLLCAMHLPRVISATCRSHIGYQGLDLTSASCQSRDPLPCPANSHRAATCIRAPRRSEPHGVARGITFIWEKGRGDHEKDTQLCTIPGNPGNGRLGFPTFKVKHLRDRGRKQPVWAPGKLVCSMLHAACFPCTVKGSQALTNLSCDPLPQLPHV